MQFFETPIAGAYLIQATPRVDERGVFSVCYNKALFEKEGLCGDFIQMNVVTTTDKGTVRGMHSRVAGPYQEEKLVRCVRGSVFDAIFDARPDSPSYGQWWGVTLKETEHQLLYIPKGCLHGYQTLEDNTTVEYQVTKDYHPESEYGYRYDDPGLGIQWPLPVTKIAEKDLAWPAFEKLTAAGLSETKPSSRIKKTLNTL